MNTIYDFLLHVFGTLPRELVAVLLGWAFSISVTQGLKFTMPLCWSAKLRETLAQLLAFVSAFGCTFFLLPTAIGAFVALIVGVWSPLAYWLLVTIVLHRFPWLQDVLSGDVRGRLSGNVRENRS